MVVKQALDGLGKELWHVGESGILKEAIALSATCSNCTDAKSGDPGSRGPC